MPVDIFAHIGFVVILLADSDKHRAVTLFGFLGNLVPGAASVHHKSQVYAFSFFPRICRRSDERTGGSLTRSIIQLRFVLEDRTGSRVDLVVIFHIAGLELDLIDERAVLVVQLDLHVIRFIFAHACVV